MIMGMLKTYIEEEAESKKLSVTEWLQKRIDEIPFCKIATHVGKFSHPDAKVSIYDTSDSPCKGYVATSNSAHDADVSVNAAYMGTAKLLFDNLLVFCRYSCGAAYFVLFRRRAPLTA